MRVWVCAVRMFDVERYAVYVVDALSEAEVQKMWCLCFDDGCRYSQELLYTERLEDDMT
jgi:hypothetical protein